MLKVITTILSVLKDTPSFLRNLPAWLTLLSAIKAAFGTEEMQNVLCMITAHINRNAPPPPSPISDGETPKVVTPKEKKRRLRRFLNGLAVAGRLDDSEMFRIARSHNIAILPNEEYYA
jgi:hypothetical protein